MMGFNPMMMQMNPQMFNMMQMQAMQQQRPGNMSRPALPQAALAEHRLFVTKIPYESGPEDIRAYFQQFGAMTDFYVPKGHASAKPRKNIAFITYADGASA